MCILYMMCMLYVIYMCVRGIDVGHRAVLFLQVLEISPCRGGATENLIDIIVVILQASP